MSHDPNFLQPMPADVSAGAPRLGHAAVAIAERLPDDAGLLGQFNFSSHEIACVRAVVEHAYADPRTAAVNARLHELEARGDGYADFARLTLHHERDVAELVVAIATREGCPDDVLADLALAGLTHDAGKGDLSLVGLFMKPSSWTAEERQQNEGHPVIARDLQAMHGLSPLVQYLTERHHQDLLPDPARHVTGGYGGQRISAPEDQRNAWEELAHIFAAADHIAANMQQRSYKPGMSAEDAVGKRLADLSTPVPIQNAFIQALPATVAA